MSAKLSTEEKKVTRSSKLKAHDRSGPDRLTGALPSVFHPSVYLFFSFFRACIWSYSSKPFPNPFSFKGRFDFPHPFFSLSASVPVREKVREILLRMLTLQALEGWEEERREKKRIGLKILTWELIDRFLLFFLRFFFSFLAAVSYFTCFCHLTLIQRKGKVI